MTTRTVSGKRRRHRRFSGVKANLHLPLAAFGIIGLTAATPSGTASAHEIECVWTPADQTYQSGDYECYEVDGDSVTWLEGNDYPGAYYYGGDCCPELLAQPAQTEPIGAEPVPGNEEPVPGDEPDVVEASVPTGGTSPEIYCEFQPTDQYYTDGDFYCFEVTRTVPDYGDMGDVDRELLQSSGDVTTVITALEGDYPAAPHIGGNCCPELVEKTQWFQQTQADASHEQDR